MAEPTMSAESVRTMLSENLDRLRKANADYFQMLEKNLASAQLPIGGHAMQYFELMQRNVTATLSLRQAHQGKGREGFHEDPVRICPGSDARNDRSGEELGRVHNEGDDRSLRAQELRPAANFCRLRRQESDGGRSRGTHLAAKIERHCGRHRDQAGTVQPQGFDLSQAYSALTAESLLPGRHGGAACDPFDSSSRERTKSS